VSGGLQIPTFAAAEWRSRMPARRFAVPDLPAAALELMAAAVGRPVTSAADGVDEIIRQVIADGDEALLRLTDSLDGVRPESLELSREEWDEGAAEVSAEARAAIEAAAARIEAFHALQLPRVLSLGEVELRPQPLRRVGIYVPGGRARYPSTVLMNAIPARLAGVDEIVMVTPPGEAGRVTPAVLYAARLAGVARVFKVGGAQAVAALAYGTRSLPPVDKITGPGNVFVVLAKRAVYGVVDIDGLAGPSEILVIADESADAGQIVADLASQLEHDPVAWAVLEAAVELASEFAPEHMELLVREPDRLLPLVRGAGMVFVGPHSPVPMGDYVAGSNHTLPTGGAARFNSPLGVYDFYRWTSVVRLSPETAREIAPVGIELAKMEGLVAHQRSLEVLLDRLEARE